MDRVAIYCRLSKEDLYKLNKGDESGSIQNQKKVLIDYALKQGWNISQIYCDEDYSGTDNERPEWNQMIKEAKAGQFDIILCKTQSRFTRDIAMVEKYFHTLFPLWNIRFVSIVDHIDTMAEGNKKVRQINALINEWYVEDLSKNIRAVYQRKMREGEYLGAYPPYGYLKDNYNKYKLIIDDEAATVVRYIFQAVKEGNSIQSICNYLTKRGVPTPTQYRRLKLYDIQKDKSAVNIKRNIKWSSTTVNRILHNEIYLGDMIQHKEEKLNYKSKKTIQVPKEEWIIVPNTHEPIIDKENFEQVQRILVEKRKVLKIKKEDT
jgi:DNA invertase Pin-like site-specific DNA recombinase